MAGISITSLQIDDLTVNLSSLFYNFARFKNSHIKKISSRRIYMARQIGWCGIEIPLVERNLFVELLVKHFTKFASIYFTKIYIITIEKKVMS